MFILKFWCLWSPIPILSLMNDFHPQWKKRFSTFSVLHNLLALGGYKSVGRTHTNSHTQMKPYAQTVNWAYLTCTVMCANCIQYTVYCHVNEPESLIFSKDLFQHQFYWKLLCNLRCKVKPKGKPIIQPFLGGLGWGLVPTSQACYWQHL